MGAPRKKNGFTLMELMMTLAVVGVILAIAIPNFRDFLLNSRMTGAANDLLAGIQLTRSESIKRQRSVAFCASNTPGAALPVCTGLLAGATAVGWVVWLDTNANSVLEAGEEILARHDPLDATLNLTTNWQTVSYAPTGFPQITPPVPTGSPAAILLCDERGDAVANLQYRKRVVSVSRTGRPAVVKATAEVDILPADVDTSCT